MRKRAESVEVCVATMHREDFSLLDYLNIQTDCIVGNQCDKNETVEFERCGRKVKWISTTDRGVGLNRNTAFMRTKSDIVLFSDDDMIFDDGYEETVLRVFNENEKADVVIFNIKEKVRKRRETTKNHYTKKIGYGAARIAVRRESVQMHAISFNLHFGGGTAHSHGEDTLFLADCVRKGLKILCVTDSVATLTEERESTWFKGYDDKYFFDKGVLIAAAGAPFSHLRGLKFALLHDRKAPLADKLAVYKKVSEGIKYFKCL